MNKLLLIIFLVSITGMYAMDRSKTAPLHFPSDEPEKELLQAFQLNDDMQLILAEKSKVKITRVVTPETMKLIRLDPNLGRTVSQNMQQLDCHTRVVEGTKAFDDAQELFLQLEATKPNSMADNTHRHDLFIEIEERQLEALCIFVSAYETGCYETYPYIASVHRAIMNLEKQRKLLKKDLHTMLPQYYEKKFLERIKKVNATEQARKNNRKSLSLPHSPVTDSNKAHELYVRAANTLRIADTLQRRVIDSPDIDITNSEYEQVESLYCTGLRKAIKSFHLQPNRDEKEAVFEEIQGNLKKIQTMQQKIRGACITLQISQEYTEIAQFIDDNRKEYEIHESQKGKVRWEHVLTETKDLPVRASEREQAQPVVAPQRSKLARLLECINCCVK